jgi:hypothetical protein
MKEYPKDIMVFHAQSASVVRFLVEKKDRATVLAFIKDGMEKNWNGAVKEHYGFADVDALEEAWLASQSKRRPANPSSAAAPSNANVLAQGPAPQTAKAEISADGRFIRVSWPLVHTAPVTAYAPRQADGQKYYELVTEYRRTIRTQLMSQQVESVKAYELDGTRIDPKKLAERLKKETAVLVTHEEGKVDPFYLQLIKPGTIIVWMAPPPAPALQPPAMADDPPKAVVPSPAVP